MIRYRQTPQHVDVGSGGDCLFRWVSHQLCGDSNRPL